MNSLLENVALEKCPYCGSENLKTIFDSEMPTVLHACDLAEVSNSIIYPVRACFCFDCGLAFNSTPLSDKSIEDIYLNCRYIRPHKKIGVSKYYGMIEMIKRNVNNSDYIVEIGASDGYIIDSLFDEGFKNIEGFEPSQEWKNMRNKGLVRNEFFSESSSFPCDVDVFYLMHVLEHFSDPWNILKIIKNKLSENGKVIFEVPNFSGFCHQHLIYFSDFFVHSLATDLGFNVIDKEINDDILRFCLEKSSDTGKVNSYSCEDMHFPCDKLEEKNRESLLEIENLKKHIAAVDDIFWWGTGSTSITILSILGELVCRDKNFIFIDSDEDRTGLVLPIPFLSNFKIESPNLACPKMELDSLLVIASVFPGEIISKIESEGYLTPKKVISAGRAVL